MLLKELLTLELMVQIVEGIFYVWLAFYISTATKITQKRYWDWVITTPVMLITLASYFIYLRITREQGSEAIPSLLDIVQTNYVNFTKIIILNALMLAFGYLGEIGVMKVVPSVFAGFVPFFAMFYLIYDQYAKYAPDGMTLFYYFAGCLGTVWSCGNDVVQVEERVLQHPRPVREELLRTLLGLPDCESTVKDVSSTFT